MRPTTIATTYTTSALADNPYPFNQVMFPALPTIGIEGDHANRQSWMGQQRSSLLQPPGSHDSAGTSGSRPREANPIPPQIDPTQASGSKARVANPVSPRTDPYAASGGGAREVNSAPPHIATRDTPAVTGGHSVPSGDRQNGTPTANALAAQNSLATVGRHPVPSTPTANALAAHNSLATVGRHPVPSGSRQNRSANTQSSQRGGRTSSIKNGGRSGGGRGLF